MIINTSLQKKKKKKKKKNRLVKSLIKKTPKKPAKHDLRDFNQCVNEKETDINSEIFQKYFKFQRSTDTLKVVYTTNDKSKNNK